MSKARRGDRRGAAAMVRAAEGLYRSPSAAGPEADQVDTDASAGAPQGNLPLPAERRRWDSLVSYPGGAAAAGGDAPGAPPPAAAEDSAAAGTPAAAGDDAASAAALRAAAEAALERKLDAIPAEPGVYLLRERSHPKAGALGKVLYVGKAK